MPSVTVRDRGDLKRLNKQLREVADGKQLGRELTGGMRAVLRPMAKQVKDAYLAAPSKGRPKTRSRRAAGSLRVLLSRSVKVEARRSGRLAGARIRADGRRMPSGMKALPRYWEGPEHHGASGRWRHPAFQDRTRAFAADWVQQPSPGTFYRTTEPIADDGARAIDRVLDGIERKLERR